MKSQKNVDCKFNEFNPVLENWCKLNEELLEIFNRLKFLKKIPWKNNERSLVSILAAAVWKSGYAAIEEFSDKKGRKKDKSEYAGRCDLGVLFPNKNKSFLFEVKKCRLTLGKREEFIEDKRKIKRALRRALRDAGKLKTEPKIIKKRFGVVFIIPRFSAEYKKAEIQERLKRFQNLVRKPFSNYGCTMAWFFVDSFEYDQVKVKEKNKEYIYPGIIIILKERKKR